MPVQQSSAYVSCEQVLNRIRMILDDSEVQGGDVLTDTAPFTFDLLNGAFERVQIELAVRGVETLMKYFWLIGLPAVTQLDPEARLIVDDTGCNIVYPNGIGNVFSLMPQLPTNLVLPVKLWERPTNTNDFSATMAQRNEGLANMQQQEWLCDWEWRNDGLYFRGALQSQDVKILAEAALQQLQATTDPVPIRGVTNAAAYFAAKIFTESRGGAIAPTHKATAQEEIDLLCMKSARRKQHKQVRRRPWSGQGGRSRPVL